MRWTICGRPGPAPTALLHDDATLSMPPYGLWLAGRSQLERWFLREASPCRGARAIPVKANGSPAFAIYHGDQRHQPPRAFAVQLVTVRDDRIAAIDMYLDPRLFRLFGLQDRLTTGSPGVHSGHHDDLVSSHA